MGIIENLQIGHSSIKTDDIRICRDCKGLSVMETPFFHRHMFHAVYWIHEGCGVHVIDFEDYEIKSDRIFYIKPEQTHFLNIKSEIRYSAIQFTEEFMLSFYSEEDIRQIKELPVYGDLSNIEKKRIRRLFDIIENEYVDNTANSVPIIQSGINILMLELERIINKSCTERNIPEIMKKYERLVDECFMYCRSVKGYAELLGVTPNYLNILSRKYLGKSALSIIHDRIVLEIKRLLIRTDKDVSEIAYGLNFNEPSYFSRFFKNETGMSPNEFRSVMNNLYHN